MGELTEFTGKGGTRRALVSRGPSAGGKGVLVVHPGPLQPLEAFADRLAAEGFVVVAAELDEIDVDGVASAAGLLLAQRDLAGPKAGVVAFSQASGTALSFAGSAPDLVSALVLFYANPTQQEVDELPIPVQVHYAGDDEHRVGAPVQGGRPGAGVVRSYNYPRAPHAFLDPTRQETLDSEVSQRAWQRMIAFLQEHAGAALTES